MSILDPKFLPIALSNHLPCFVASRNLGGLDVSILMRVSPWSWVQPVQCLNSSLTSCCIRQLALSHSVVFFLYFFACHEHFDSLKTPILTRCPALLSFLRVFSSCLFHDPVFSLINVPTMRDAVISCSHLLSSSLSHLEWDEVTLTRGRRFTTSAESGRLLPFGRVFEFFFSVSLAPLVIRESHIFSAYMTTEPKDALNF